MQPTRVAPHPAQDRPAQDLPTPFRRPRSRLARSRRGLSLMEAMISLAILGGALAAIGELIRLGARAAEDARDLTKSQLICDSLTSEIAAGVAMPTAASHSPCPGFPEFVYTLQIASATTPDLLHIKLTIEREKDIAINNPRGLRYAIERFIPDPNSQTFKASYAAGSPEPAKVDFSGAFSAGLSNMLGGAAGGAATTPQGAAGAAQGLGGAAGGMGMGGGGGGGRGAGGGGQGGGGQGGGGRGAGGPGGGGGGGQGGGGQGGGGQGGGGGPGGGGRGGGGQGGGGQGGGGQGGGGQGGGGQGGGGQGGGGQGGGGGGQGGGGRGGGS